MKQFILSSFLSIFAYVTLVGQTIDHWESVISAGDEWHYFIGNEAPPQEWFEKSFDPSNWNKGMGGFGYGDNDDGTIIETTYSVFLRKTFEIADKSLIEKFLLEADYDDAFVAYLNGVEIARSNIGIAGTPVAFDDLPFTDHEASLTSGNLPERFTFHKSDWESIIVEGENVLAIQVNNYLISSSDLSSNFWWIAGLNTPNQIFQNTPSWFVPPITGFESELPIIIINTLGSVIPEETKTTAEMGIIHQAGLNHSDGEFNHFDGKIGIELRGSSSSWFAKTGYSIETRNEDGSNLNIELLGMPKENDWVFHGPYSDKTLIRNALAYTIAGNTMEYAPRVRFCELIINNDYLGIYLLTEKIKRDKNRVDVDPVNIDTVSQTGFIIKVDKISGENVGGWWSDERVSKHGWLNNFYQYHYPKPDQITDEQAAYIRSYFFDFENLLFSDDWLDEDIGWKTKVDIASIYNFFFINELAKNVDGYRLSTYMFKEAEEDGGILKFGPVWDFNLGFANADYCTGGGISGWVFSDFPDLCWDDGSQIPIWWQRFFEDEAFIEGLKMHWETLRAETYSTENVWQLVDSLNTDISSAVDRNFDRWNVLGNYLWPNYRVFDTHAEEINYLKDWLEDRLEWMDQNIPLLKLDTTFVYTPSQAIINPKYYPNPFSDILQIQFQTEDHFPFIDIRITDFMGRNVFTKKFSELNRNGIYYNILLDESLTQNLAKGAYFIQLSINEEEIGKQVLIKLE